MNDDRLEIGVIGLGTHGLNRAQVLADFEHSVYGSDVNPDARETFERWFSDSYFRTPSDLFDQEPDAVVIATPNKYHERGIDVFIEKPLAHPINSAERIAETAANTGRI
jgi:predicted dehydrogenase